MKPQRPYLLRALYDWLIDSDDVPYVLVDATAEGVIVPTEHVKDGQIVLNLGPNAVRDLVLEQDYVMCSSRFGGRAFELYLPMASVRAIYGRDSQQGMVFPEEEVAAVDGEAPKSEGPRGVQATTHDDKQGDDDKDGDDEGGRPPLRLV